VQEGGRNVRHTGIPIIGDVPWGTHFCQFYQDKQDLIDILVPYFKAGLENNEFCMWVTSEPLRVEEAKAALAEVVKDLEGYIGSGQIEFLDYTEWYTPGGKFESDRVLRGWVERLESAINCGFDGLRLTGNTFWLEKSDWQDFTEYEASVDGVIGQYPMLAICTYSLAKCGAVEIMDVVSNHAFALIKRAGKWQIVESAERKRMEASLRASEEAQFHLAAIVASSADAIIGKDVDGTIRTWNNGAERMYGYTSREAIGQQISLIGPPEQHDEFRSLMECVRRGDLIQDYETINIRKDGSRIPVALTLSPIRDQTGTIAGISSIARDITERKKAEQERRHLASFPEMNANPVIEIDPQGTILYANPAVHKILETLGIAQDLRVFLPSDISRIMSAAEGAFRREIVIGEKIFAEEICVWKDPGIIRIYARDITERKQAEDALREHREWLRVTLTSIGDAVLATDTAGRITFLNPVAADLTGWTEKDALGRPVQEVFHIINENTREEGEDIVARVLREGCAVSLANNTALVAREGRAIPIEDSAAPIRDRAGKVTGVVLVFHDVTQKRRSQEALRESEQRVRVKLESILTPQGDIGALELGDIIDAPAIQSLMDDFYAIARIPMAMIDLKGKVLVGVGWQEICTGFHRVHPQTCQNCIESDTQLSAGVAPGECRLYQCKNHMWDIATPLMVGGKQVGNLFCGQFFFDDEAVDTEVFRAQALRYGFDTEQYLAALEAVPRLSRESVKNGIAFLAKLGHTLSLVSYSNIKLARSLAERDALTASLQESSERLKHAQAIANLGSWELDIVQDRLTWSDEVYRIFGLHPQEFGATYEAFLEAVHPDDRAAVDAAYSDSVRERTPSYEITHRVVRRASGEVRWVHERCEHITDATGNFIRSIGMVQDITERTQAEERLRERQKLESIGLLAGGIAHDFNNLLVGVMGNASLAREMLPPGHDSVELLDGVIRSGDQLAHLTRQMLAYSGKGRFVVEPLDLSDLIPEMSGLVQPSIPKKILLHMELEPNLPLVKADRGQMQQIFMNLVLNAAEAIGSNAGLISVKTGFQAVDEAYIRRNPEAAELHHGKYVCLEVRDTGCGMDQATKAKIFDPFFSTKFTGRGLGLAAVAGIVRGHKGAIKVSSAPGKGSCFTVLFPEAQGAVAVPPLTGCKAALKGKGTVLVVDDEKTVRELAKNTLERYGYKVLAACSGSSAIDIFKRHPGDISLVILDLSMPAMGGDEALPELRKIRPDVKVMVSSGYSEAETMALFRGQVVSGFVQKPYTSTRLAEKVNMALG
jgi:PAS domain S-box-containing protein